MRNFQGYFSGTFQDLKLQFPGLTRTGDFPGLFRSWNFKEKIKDFPGGTGTLIYVCVS